MKELNNYEIGEISGGNCECCCGYPDVQQDIGCFSSSTECAAGCWVQSGTYYHNCGVPCQSGYDCNASMNMTKVAGKQIGERNEKH